jgi:hypothetical protein
MKKTDAQIWLQQNKDKLWQRTQGSPQEQPQRRNPASNQSNQWKFYRDDTRYGQPKCTGDTEEILRQQKQRIWESTRTNKRNYRITVQTPKWEK